MRPPPGLDGFAILPCRGKVPLTPHGCVDASADARQVEAWHRQWPDADWAIATGSPSGGLLVVDLDGIDGPADAAWTQILNDCGGRSRTVCVLSGSGRSMHWYYRLPEGVVIGNTIGRLAPGIDTRGERGYVICPPSIHRETGLPYTWLVSPDDEDVAAIPEGLLQRLTQMAGQPRPSPLLAPTIVMTERSGRAAMRILATECEAIAAATAGTRNHAVFKASAAIGNLVAAGELMLRVAELALQEAALACGLPSSEAAKAVQNGLRRGMTTPRLIRGRVSG